MNLIKTILIRVLSYRGLRETYLARAMDHADLERRIRNLERSPSFGPDFA